VRFSVDTPIGSAEYTQPIQLADKAIHPLTTEKPIYQPGQTIHVRALRSGPRRQQGGRGSQADV
jgi:hypothetical protein